MDLGDDKNILRNSYLEQRPLTLGSGGLAGQELFVVHEELLMRYCLSEAGIDFDGKFSPERFESTI
jgi:hypothetical protein